MSDMIADILAALGRAPGAGCETSGHVLADGKCASCGTAFPAGMTVPVRTWVRSADADGRDTSRWVTVQAEAQPAPKVHRRHVPVGIPYTPRDVTPGVTERSSDAVAPGSDMDWQYTGYAEQTSGLLLDKALPPKQTMRTHRAPMPWPAPADLVSDDCEADQRARRRQVAADLEARSRDTSRDLIDAILTVLRNEGSKP